MTIFMSFQWLTGKMKAGSARLASAVSTRTWVVRRSLSNRQMLKVCSSVLQSYPKSGKIRSKVALSIRAPLENTRHWKCFGRDGAGGSADRRARPAVRQTMSRPEPDGAALLIAETVAALTQLVRRHKAKRARACVHAFH